MSKKGGGLYNPPKKRAIGLLDHLPVLSTQEIFRHENMDDSLSPVHTQMTPQYRGLTPTTTNGQAVAGLLTASNRRHNGELLINRNSNSSPQAASPAPSGAPASSTVYDRTAAEIAKYIDAEIALLGTREDGAATQPGVQRLTIFKEAFRMLLPQLVPTVSSTLQRIMREYDKFLVDIERSTVDATQKRERERLEQHYQKHFMEEAQIKEIQLQQREAEFAARESDMRLKLKQLENQLNAVKEDNCVLRAQQNEDTEKYATMAQAVVESRLTAQRADIVMTEMREHQAKRDVLERNQRALLEDATAMYNLLRKNNIPFQSTSKFIFEASD